MPTVEDWMQDCTIATSREHFIDSHAAGVEGGLKIRRGGGVPWVENMGERVGVAILHPLAMDTPAVIRFRPKRTQPQGSHLRIVMRASDVHPGVSLKIKSGEKVVLEAPIQREWQELLTQWEPERGSGEMRIEVWPDGWHNEYAYIDSIGLVSVMPIDRVLTDLSGRKLSVTVLEKHGTGFKVRRASDGKEFIIDPASLCSEDQGFLMGLLAPMPPPESAPAAAAPTQVKGPDEMLEISVKGAAVQVARLGKGPLGVLFFAHSGSRRMVENILSEPTAFAGLVPDAASFFLWG